MTDSTLLELHAGEHAMVDKIRDKASRARVVAMFRGKRDSWFEIWDALHSCAFELLMQPTRRLTALTDDFFSRHGVQRGADGEPLAASAKLADLDGDTLHNGSTVVVTRLPAGQVAERLGLYQSMSKKKKKRK